MSDIAEEVGKRRMPENISRFMLRVQGGKLSGYNAYNPFYRSKHYDGRFNSGQLDREGPDRAVLKECPARLIARRMLGLERDEIQTRLWVLPSHGHKNLSPQSLMACSLRRDST